MHIPCSRVCSPCSVSSPPHQVWFSHTPRVPCTRQARLIVAGVCSPPLVVAAVSLAGRYLQRGELVFRTVGANTALQAACRRVLTAQSLLKLDAQLALSTVLLIVHDTGAGGHLTVTETAVLSAGGALTVLWWLAGYAALRWEAGRVVRYLLVPAAALEPAYIVWRLVTDGRADGVLLQCERAAAALALLVRALLVICLISCVPNFGLGVGQHSEYTLCPHYKHIVLCKAYSRTIMW